jgi:hypothetical protein
MTRTYVQVSKRSFSHAISAIPNPLLIGKRGGYQEFPLDGLIDELAIWQRALNRAEIDYLYNRSKISTPGCGWASQPSSSNL